mmetsp:Transcript_3435/g.11865  ORF Transcript_3435/g.11865 Transcript_3435/m.11865 type:complete len:166 (+) Transcript_3435:164-661(+)
MDFNLGQKKNCLIGNWSEEKALHDYTGHFRMPADGPKGRSTFKRCIEHSQRADNSDLKTSSKLDFSDPRAEHVKLNYQPDSTVGAREKMLLQRLKTVARLDTSTTTLNITLPVTTPPASLTQRAVRNLLHFPLPGILKLPHPSTTSGLRSTNITTKPADRGGCER